MTPEALQVHIATLEAKREELLSEVRIVEGQLKLYRAELHLRIHGQPSTLLSTQMQDAARARSHETNVKTAHSLSKHLKNRFVSAVLAHPDYGSVTRWAADHCKFCTFRRAEHGSDHEFVPLPLANAASWYSTHESHDRKRPARTTGRRPIPRRWANAIELEFSDPVSGKSLVPADSTTWTNGIKD